MKTFLLFGCALLLSLNAGATGSCQAQFKPAWVELRRPTFDPDRSWAEQMLLRDLTVLKEFFKNTAGFSNDRLIEEMTKRDLRGTIFRIEGLTKLYGAKDEALITELHTTFKAIEDAIGAVTLQDALIAKSQEIGAPELVAFFTEKRTAAKLALAQALSEEGFLKNPVRAVNALIREISDADWKGPKKDRKFFVREMREFVEKLEAKIEKRKFDSAEIEEGLHELRRQLRWILVFVQAFEGTTAYGKETELKPAVRAWLDEMTAANPKLHENKFLQFPPSLAPEPVVIPQLQYAMISEIVQTIGKLKDGSESRIYITEALRKLRLSPAREQELTALVNERIPRVDHRRISNRFQDRLEETELLKRFRKALKELNSDEG